MTATDRTSALATRWVAAYTRRLDPEVAARRRAELASDLWEQRAHANQVGAPGLLVALSILRRAVLGVPADLHWRHQQLAAAHGRPRRQGGWQMASTRTRALARSWWRVLAVLIIPGYAVVAYGIMIINDAPEPLWPNLFTTGAIVAIAAAVLIAAGIVARHWARATGDVLIALGALPAAIMTVWLFPAVNEGNLFVGGGWIGAVWVLAPLAMLLVVVMAVLDAADARSLAGRTTSAQRWRLAAAASAAVVITGIGFTQVNPVVVLAMGGTALLAILAVAGYRRRRRTA
jgi:cation transport ATPase